MGKLAFHFVQVLKIPLYMQSSSPFKMYALSIYTEY